MPRWPSMSIMPIEDRFWPKVSRGEGCWLWVGSVLKSGYGQIEIKTGPGKRDRRTERAHRIAWMLSFGQIPEGAEVLHTCDTPLCVRPDHLFLGTQADNIADCISKGRAWWQ
jgi:HNH endonuclease